MHMPMRGHGGGKSCQSHERRATNHHAIAGADPVDRNVCPIPGAEGDRPARKRFAFALDEDDRPSGVVHEGAHGDRNRLGSRRGEQADGYALTDDETKGRTSQGKDDWQRARG